MNLIKILSSGTSELIGFCRSGPSAGLYVRATRVATGESQSDAWDFEFSGAVVAEGIFPEDITSIDLKHPGDREFLRSLGIENIPEPWASRVRCSLFERSKTGSRPPSDWDGSGRFHGSTPLCHRLEMLERRATANNEVLASGSTLGVADLRNFVREDAEVFDSLSLVLAAFGLSLAIVPASTAVHSESTEPWKEFGGS